MAEQSHLDEMRKTIRADRERAAKRLGHAAPPPPAPPTTTAEPPPPQRDGARERVRKLLRRRG